jgi:hypothetical protein
MTDKKINPDLLMMKKQLEKEMQKRYKVPFFRRFEWPLEGLFDKVLITLLFCVVFIFRPINILIGGIILIIILLL